MIGNTAAAAVNIQAEMPQQDLSLAPYLGEVEAAIDKLKNHKSARVCRILPEMIKCGGKTVAKWLHHIIAPVWESGSGPADWKKALLVPVLKNGNPVDLDNYRGISLLSIAGKVYALILQSRLAKWAEELLSDE